MATPTVLSESTSTCAYSTALLGGSTTTEVNAFSDTISAWTDGASVTLGYTYTEPYLTTAVAFDGWLSASHGVGANATTCPNGCYVGTVELPGTGSGVLVSDAWVGYYSTAYVAGGSSTGNAGAVNMSTDLKYGTVNSPVGLTSVDFVTLNASPTQSFYFPKEPTTAADGETSATGDRWNSGDAVVMYFNNMDSSFTVT